MAHLDDVLTDGRAAELPVKGRGSGDLRGRDVGNLAQAPQGFVRQVAVVGLYGLQQRDGGLAVAADARYGFVHEREVDGLRGRGGLTSAGVRGAAVGRAGGLHRRRRNVARQPAPGKDQEDDGGRNQSVAGPGVAALAALAVVGDALLLGRQRGG